MAATSGRTSHGASEPQVRAQIAERIASGRLDLPLLHDVAFQVLELTTSSEADARRLAHLIHCDQVLATHVLRVANSPVYLPREPIVSLQQAIARLGFQALRDIIVAVSVRAKVFSSCGLENEARALWRHSLATGAFAREIARHRRRDLESAFLAGLLHDVGKPVVLKAAAELIDDHLDVLSPGFVASVVDDHHLAVGELLARKWTLPATVVEAIAFHHSPDDARQNRDVVQMAALADRLAYAIWPDFVPARVAPGDAEELKLRAELELDEAAMHAIDGRRESIEELITATDF